MWFRSFRDYETDKPLIKYQVQSGQGIIGSEMHDLNGWGNIIHIPVRKRKSGLLARLLGDNNAEHEEAVSPHNPANNSQDSEDRGRS